MSDDEKHDELVDILVGLKGLISASGGQAIVQHQARISRRVMRKIDELCGKNHITREHVEQALRECEC